MHHGKNVALAVDQYVYRAEDTNLYKIIIKNIKQAAKTEILKF